MSSRDEFIEWYKTVPYFKQVDLCSCNGIFIDARTRVMYEAWQASREQMKKECIEACIRNRILVTHKNQLDNDIAYNLAVHDCMADIEALE